VRILGIDPGSTVTGFGVVERKGSALHHVAHGTLRPPRAGSVAERLAFIQQGLAEVVTEHAPEAAAIERVFVRPDNPRSALVLGQARGVALAVLGAAGLVVDELTPQEVKAAVAGTGSATKDQIQRMVQRFLTLATAPPQDAADALAVAICRVHRGRLAGLPARPASGRGRGRARKSGDWVVRRSR
jgi:crossover junction endodeoxyribonuclease RuvC